LVLHLPHVTVHVTHFGGATLHDILAPGLRKLLHENK